MRFTLIKYYFALGFLPTAVTLVPKMRLSVGVTSLLIWLGLAAYLGNSLHHQMLVSTGVLGNALSQRSRCKNAVSHRGSVMTPRSRVGFYGTAVSAQGVVVRPGCAAQGGQERGQGCEHQIFISVLLHCPFYLYNEGAHRSS